MPDGRFAPSPTGPLHLGNLRTALVAWLLARHDGSRFLLRIEDLDAAGSRPEHERAHRDDLEALGLAWDGDVVRQSERRARYRIALDHLTTAGRTYPCYCTRKEIAEATHAPHGAAPHYPGTCRNLTPSQRAAREAAGRPPALRLRGDDEEVAFTDRWHGTVRGVVDDVVLRRNDGAPAYNLAVVVDDAEQGIAEVARGDDLLPATPAQVLLGRLLGAPTVTYAHVPLVLAPDGQRLAKRHGAVTLADQRRIGHTPASVLAVLGASLGLCEPEEAVDAGGLLARFDPDAVPRVPWRVPASLVATG